MNEHVSQSEQELSFAVDLDEVELLQQQLQDLAVKAEATVESRVQAAEAAAAEATL